MDIKELNIEGERVFVIGGSWIKFGVLMFILLIIAGVVQEYSTAVERANECIPNILNTIILP